MSPSEIANRWLPRFLWLLLIACITRLWLMPLPSSFWLDELFTAFLVQVGTSHPSLAAAPQVVESVYYVLPRLSVSLFGAAFTNIEVAYRLPSALAMAAALFLIARLAARLIHPQAGWFAVFACLGLGGFNYQAADARPYALGTCAAAAGFLFLVRWLDSAKWSDALVFVFFAGLLWRVHLIYWPLYIAFGLYACVRLARQETGVSRLQTGGLMAALALTLLPVLVRALAILSDARAHAFAPAPEFRELFNSFKLGLVAVSGLGGWLIAAVFAARMDSTEHRNATVPPSSARPMAGRVARRFYLPQKAMKPSLAAAALIGGWWLLQPLCLFVYSHLSGNGVFLYRYLSVALPGTALAATLMAGIYTPPRRWAWLAAALGTGVFLSMGRWSEAWPRHDLSDWRGAAAQIQALNLGPDTPVVCPSPILEARPPDWRPDYALPGLFYVHLQAYPIQGKPYLLPFEASPEAEQYAAALARETLSRERRFLVYGWDGNTQYWVTWFANRPELAGWRQVRFGPFGNVGVVLFETNGVE